MWPDYLQQHLHVCLTEVLYYDEMSLLFARLQKECKDFIAAVQLERLPIEQLFPVT